MMTTNVTSIQAHQTLMNANANNVANVKTDGFVPTNGTTVQNSSNSVAANLATASDSGATQSQTQLSKELTDQVVIEESVGANVAAIKTQDEMLGTLLDLKV